MLALFIDMANDHFLPYYFLPKFLLGLVWEQQIMSVILVATGGIITTLFASESRYSPVNASTRTRMHLG